MQLLALLLERRIPLRVLRRRSEHLPTGQLTLANLLGGLVYQSGRRQDVPHRLSGLLWQGLLRPLLLSRPGGRHARIPPASEQRHRLVLRRLEHGVSLLERGLGGPRRVSCAMAARSLLDTPAVRGGLGMLVVAAALAGHAQNAPVTNVPDAVTRITGLHVDAHGAGRAHLRRELRGMPRVGRRLGDGNPDARGTHRLFRTHPRRDAVTSCRCRTSRSIRAPMRTSPP